MAATTALSSSFITSNLNSKSINFKVFNPLHRRSDSRSSSISRKLCQVRATTLSEKEEKVNVENSFPAKTLPENEQIEISDESSGSMSGAVDSWVIRLEQSINVLLTVDAHSGQHVTVSHFAIFLPILESVVKILSTLYRDRDYARFFVLETIARVPYFAFISVLHMYESFGWWRRADYLKVHFAETVNELHHLLIMEELGGNSFWFDRFLAQHIAIFYYFMTAFMYALSPRMAYHFSECVEKHAYSTYDKFLKVKGEELKKLPAPQVAINYYMNEDMYMFDEFQTSRPPNTRRPKIENLYDVFLNIRDDEGEHCKTMKACQTHGNLKSPHSTQDLRDSDEESGCIVPESDCEGFVDCLQKSLSSRK